MHNQLVWVCPICGATARISKVHGEIHCACHSIFKADGTVMVAALRIDEEIVRKRIAACTVCKQYRGHRCIDIEMGCRGAYQRQLYRVSGQCPNGKWPIEAPEQSSQES